MANIKPYRLIFLLGIGALLAFLLYVLSSNKTWNMVERSVKLRVPIVGEKVGFPIRWTTGGMFILARQKNYDVIATLYNPLTSSARTVTNIAQTISNFDCNDWRVYAHSNWVVLDSISETNSVSLLFDLDHATVITNRSIGFLHGNLFWMPTELAWLRICGSRIRIERMNGGEQNVLNEMFKPTFPIGFLKNYVFACATNDLIQSGKNVSPYPETIKVEFWNLEALPKLLATKTVRIKGDKIVMGVASEQGDRILWICFHQLPFPSFSFSDGSFSPRYDIRLYISSNNTDCFNYIGSFTSTDEFPHIQWLSNGTGLLYEYNGEFYIYLLAK